MANKLIRVCDICGQEAHGDPVKVDVCRTHGASLSKASTVKRSRRPAPKVPCPVCGKPFAKQGMPGHMRTHESAEKTPETEMAPV